MSKRHFSCWNERTRADFHVYRQHCTKDKKEAGKKNKKKIKLFQIPKMPGPKEKRTTTATKSVWCLKGDNSCDIPVECTGWTCPADASGYLSIRTSTGRVPRRVHKHKQVFIHHPASSGTPGQRPTLRSSSDFQSWCSGWSFSTLLTFNWLSVASWSE